MSLNLALVVSGNASGAKDAAQQTKAEIGSIRGEAVSASAAMAAANDQAVASSRRVTEALASQAAAERNLRAEIDRRLSVGANVQQVSTPFANDALRAADIDAYGRSLDALRARFNPIYAAIAQYKQAVTEARQAERLGAISADEMTAAIGRQRQATLASIAAIKSRQAANQNGGAGGPNFGALNATSQFQDIAITSLMGQSPLTIALQQGTQLGMALQSSLGEGGAAGAANVLKSALFGLFTPVNLVAIGLTAVVAAGIQFGSKLFPQVKSLDDLMKQHEETLKDLGNAYGDVAAKGRGVFSAANQNSFGLAASNTINGLRLGIAQANRDALSQILIDRGSGASGNQFGPAQIVGSEFKPFEDAIEHLRKTARDGQPDILGFRKMVEDRWALTPNDDAVTTAAGKLIEFTKDAAGAAKALLELEIIKRRLFDDVGPNGFLLSRGTSNQADIGNLAAFEAQQAVARARAQQSFNADVLGINARAPEERAAAARASAAATYNSDETPAARSQRIELAGKKALIEAEHQLTVAQQERMRSLDQAIASAQLDASLIGKSTAETEALRFENERLAQVREEAARNGIAVDQAEIASIHAKAVEYGKLVALQEARSTIKSQQDDIELQRAELGLVGANSLARDRAIASLKTEQEIRKLGIPLYGDEAEAMRKNTAELSSLAEAMAKAKLQQDLLFKIRQAGRSPEDQSIASQLRSAGLPEDLNSYEAGLIRASNQLDRMKETWQSIFDVANQGVDALVNSLFDGTEGLKDAGRDLAKLGLQLALSNPLKNWLTGADLPTIGDLGIFPGAWSGKGGGFGGVLGQMLGAQKAVASMQVQAASVFINGSPIGVPGLGGLPGAANDNGGVWGWFKSLFGGSSTAQPFKADTTLTDFLAGGPNTAATASKLLSGLGSPLGASVAGSGSALSQVFASAGFTKTGIPLSSISIDGLTAKVATEYAGRFQGLLNDLKAAGYPITSLGEGGYSFRNVAGTNNLSNHAFGNALDINPRQNPWAVGAKGNFAQYGVDPSALAEKNGLFWGGNWRKADAMHFQVDKSIDPATTQSISKLGETAASAASTINVAGLQVSQSLVNAAGGLNNFGSMLSSFMASPTGGGSSWFQSLASMFGGSGGALNFMSGISPAATGDILSGSWGLFAKGAAFRNGNVVPFAKGDVFSSPTYFPMSAGRTGVLGEDGEEAVMPLQRGPDGRLGVVNHQPLRAPRAANSNNGAGGGSGGLTRGHIEGIVNAISDKLKLNANIINLTDGSDIKRYLMSEDGHNTVAIVNKRISGV
ncbi:hypothetical protein EOA37_09710 [Mesorhizobium sp. M2A.F.Ca.ET.015.02.1.1]|uniref:M15 family metallopeptidase n=1 Tax=Mesorhizobium sp. M2A.F.Ca.ET.015.02.1.1 TaxID=2496758 RepID=UPI000FCB1781|nr:hypothetical protein EOA37_09710 [Mesorhizobium sp. M2A.F.Ca.ET.015.02.1.1]